MSGRRRVLLVDDCVVIRGSVARGLTSRGYEVVAASSVRDALAQLEAERRIQLCVLDVGLPDGHGLKLMSEILIRQPATRIVILSGYVTTPLTVDAVKRGAFDVLAKPASIETIVFSLERPETTNDNNDDVGSTAVPFHVRYARLERELIDHVMGTCEWNISRAAEALGLHRQSLQRKLKKLCAPGDGDRTTRSLHQIER